MVMEMVDSPLAPALRRVRRDALPEEIQYRGDGCDIHSQCLTCPLPRCRYDEPGGVRAMLNSYRDRQILAPRGAGGGGGRAAGGGRPPGAAGVGPGPAVWLVFQTAHPRCAAPPPGRGGNESRMIDPMQRTPSRPSP